MLGGSAAVWAPGWALPQKGLARRKLPKLPCNEGEKDIAHRGSRGA